PIMAKGVEDTVFYIFNRLAALNEVGGEPEQFGSGIEPFHRANQDRHRDWPGSLLATSTHDTKRSEDARARIVAISEISQTWRRFLQRARTVNRRFKQRFEELEAPDANEEYLLYQTLLGTWPVDAAGNAEHSASPEYIERIQNYMHKALNEAKLNTSWIQPNEEWLHATGEFVGKIMDGSAKNKFLPLLFPLVEEIAGLGAINSLTQTLLKLTAPGVPDIYQGNEIWDFSLVDPDNRRPVDYELRRQMLDALRNTHPEALLSAWADGHIKLFLVHRLLQFRRQHVDLFQSGRYLPIQASGTFAECCVGFARELNGRWIAVIAPRLPSRVGFPPVGDRWQNTVVDLPEGLLLENVRNLFTGNQVRIHDRRINIGDTLSVLPFAAITNLL
ncbi:MAG TPA: hypothetical protein VFO22_07500, partial [Candidatus Udaeobacter sp.]|nr:hypothetical protein [Candidatus Udaeobacter sp.]